MRPEDPISEEAPDFTWHEALHSAKAVTLGISNTPSESDRLAIIATAKAMQGVRSLLGNRSIRVTSWYRNPAVNRAVGGSRTSDHMSGRAVDFRFWDMTGVTAMDIATRIASSPLMFDQLILYSNRVHLGWADPKGPRPDRREIKTAIKGGYVDGLWPEKAI